MKNLKHYLTEFMDWMARDQIFQQDPKVREGIIDAFLRDETDVRKIILHHPTGHPYWNSGEFTIEFSDGSFYDLKKHNQDFGHGYRIDVRPDGIYYVLMFCGSGYGKVECTDGRFPPIKIIPASEYDVVLYEGDPLVMSEYLKDEIELYYSLK